MEHDTGPEGPPDIGFEDSVSFRNPPEGMDCPPVLSVPMGHRSILADVRAHVPARHHNLVLQPHHGSAVRSSLQDKVLSHQDPQVLSPIPTSFSLSAMDVWRGGTMSRGHNPRRTKDMDAFTWLSSVKVGWRRESSEGLQSGTDSAHESWCGPNPRQPELEGENGAMSRRRSSNSRSMVKSTNTEGGGGSQTLQDEYVPPYHHSL